LKFSVLTSCDENFSELQDITSPNVRSYCEKHGYDCKISRIIEKERPASWYKIKKILNAFDDDYDYVFWIDADAIFVNKNIKLEDFIEENKLFYFSCNWAALNAGVFMMKNTEFNKEFLNKVWNYNCDVFNKWWEQLAIISLLESGHYPENLIKELPASVFNSEEYWSGCFVYHMIGEAYSDRLKKFRKILSKNLLCK
jgi:hypothetical protein